VLKATEDTEGSATTDTEPLLESLAPAALYAVTVQ
jgi:hypothetical protein